MSIGTRGDIEPFLAIGEILANKGHQVVYAFPEQYGHLVPNNSLYYPFTAKFLGLIEGEDGRALMGGATGIFKKMRAALRLYKQGIIVNKILVEEQYDVVKKESPDLIVHNGKCNYPVLWQILIAKKIVLISPVPYFMHYVEGQAHIGFSGDYGQLLNKLTYQLANFGLVKTIYDAQKALPNNNQKASRKQIRGGLFSQKLIYTISPALFSRPKGWPSNIQVLGHHEKAQQTGWQPDENLSNFFKKHPKILFLTFGSMINPNPEKTTRIILNVLRELQIPTLINTAAGGLVLLEAFEQNPLFYFTKQVPYDQALTKCYAIIHHGGSGTTHCGLKHACVSMIIPHIFDQYGWNNLIAKNELGPKGIPVNKITEQNLKPLILELFENQIYKMNAVNMAAQMQQEHLEEMLYTTIIS
jgi:UDP:flavonoid glycosyltransferase YjiC (YdhE family)